MRDEAGKRDWQEQSTQGFTLPREQRVQGSRDKADAERARAREEDFGPALCRERDWKRGLHVTECKKRGNWKQGGKGDHADLGRP